MPDSLEKLPIFQCFKLKKIDPNKTVFIFVNTDGSEERVTYKDIFENTNRISHILLKNGIQKGDSFTLLMRNHPEFLYSMFAALSIGALVVPVDPRSKGSKLSFQINNTKSKGIIISDEFIDNIKEIEKEINQVPIIGVNYKSHHNIPVSNGYPSLNEILETENPNLPDRMIPFSRKTPVQIIHTSGTTGDPKGVVLKASRFKAYGLLNLLLWKYRNDDIPYTGLSMTHGNAQSVTVFPTLAKKNIHAVISEKFTKSRIWDICRKYNCTTFSLLGGMMSGIYNEPVKGDDPINPVRKVISAGTPKAIWKDFEERFDLKIHEWYAAIEGGVAHNPPMKGPIGSFGKPNILMHRMKIVDENDKPVPKGEKGELISKITFRKTIVNYFGKKKESKAKTRNGWLRSGDICHQDKNGYFYFDFRKGGGLRRQGDFIQPDMVEKVIGRDENISEVCVYGIPALSGAPGESDLVAVIACFEGKHIDKKHIKKICYEGLERNSVPTYLQIVDEIPKTISEKPLERVLRDNFKIDAPNVFKL